jgi:sugar/nucleoside kinase (ribokinase family)
MHRFRFFVLYFIIFSLLMGSIPSAVFALELSDPGFTNDAGNIDKQWGLSKTRIIQAWQKSKGLAWNPGGCQIEQSMHAPDKAALLKGTYLLLLNKEEALTFTKTDDVQKALTALVKAGVKNICITDGKNGTWATDGKNTYRCPILKVKAVDTTGAGDAFGTGALWALLSGNSLQEALVAGTLNAASVVGSIGAQAGLLTDIQIDQKLREHPIAVEILD